MEIKNNKNKEFLDCVELTQTDNRAFLDICGESRELKAYTLFRSMTGGAFLECEFMKGGKKGLFTIKETAITHSDGRVTIGKTVKVTGNLCVPMRAAREIVQGLNVEPRRFFERIRADGLTRKRSKGFSFPVRIGDMVSNCLWLSAK